MDKLEKLYNMLKEDGHTEDDYSTFKEHYSKPENKETLYGFLTKEQYYTKDMPTFEAQFFQTEGEKKKTTEVVPLFTGSGGDSKTGSVVTPQSKPAVSPAKPTYLYGQEKEVVAPAAGENTPVPGLGGAPMEVKTATVISPTKAILEANKNKPFVDRVLHPEKYPSLKEGNDAVTHKMSYAEADGKFYAFPTVQYDPKTKKLTDRSKEEGFAAFDAAMNAGDVIEFKTAKEAEDFTKNYKTGTPLEKMYGGQSHPQPLQKEKEQATGMKEMFQKFQDYRNQATIAAQKNTMDEAVGNIEYKKSQRDPNPDWAEQQKYALEDAQAAERAKVATTQPLVSKMLDYYDAKAGDTEWEDNRLVKALSYTSPPAALLAGGPGGMFAGDRDDSPVVALKEQLVGTPEGAALEQELQKIYKRTNLKDQTSVDNALLDAKQLMFEKLADKDVAIWDDFAQTNKAMADYNPTAYHARTRGKMEQKYAAAGIDKSMIDSKLMDHSLNRGVMDEERTAEAKAVLNLRTIKDEVSRAEREGSVFRIDQAKQKLAAAEKEVQVMESKRLSALDSKIEEIQNAIVTETDPKKIEIYKKGLNLVKAQRAGFINPNSQVMAAYAKFQDQADAVSPQGTPMERLQKLYAELEFDRQEIMGRIQQAEAKFGGAGLAANEILNSLPGNSHNDDHKLLLRTEAQLKDLAPIIFLNENPAVQDKKSGFWKHQNTAFLTTLAGDGSMFSNTQRQEDAINLYRNLQVAGVSPEVLNDPTMMGIKDRMDNPGLDSWDFWGDITGSSTGIMLPLIVTTAATRGIGLSSAIGRIVQVGNRALGLSGKYAGAILPLLGDAIESGINYEAAGRYVSVHNDKELDFLGGLLGGAASSFGSGAFTSAKKVVTRMFGDKAQDAANMFVNFGASRLGSGTGELSEEFGQQVGQLWEASSTGQEFWKRMEEQFGTFDEASKFVVSTMVLGMAMGGAHSGGFGEYLYELNQKKLNELPPEERTRVQPVIDQLQDEQLALVEGGLNATAEDVASVEAEQEGIEPEKKKSAVSITTKESEQGISGDIVIEGKPEGHFNVAIEGDQAHLADIQIGYDEESGQAMRGKGYGTEAYVQIGDQLAEQGVTLTSTNFGESQTSISPQALSVWEKLVKEGRARITGQIEGKVVDRFTGKESVETINTYEFIPSKDAVSPAAEITNTASGATVETKPDGEVTISTESDGVPIEIKTRMDRLAEAGRLAHEAMSAGDAFIQESPAAEETTIELNTVPYTQEEINQRRGKQQAPTTDESISFDTVKEGDTVIHNGETVVVVSKGKSRGGADVVTLKGRNKTLEEIKKDAIATIRQRHGAEYAKRPSDEQLIRNHVGEYTDLVSQGRKVEETKTATFTVDRDSFDAETKRGEAPTPIAAEETVVAESPVPVTQRQRGKEVSLTNQDFDSEGDLTDDGFAKAENRLVEIISEVAAKFGIDPRRILTHYNINERGEYFSSKTPILDVGRVEYGRLVKTLKDIASDIFPDESEKLSIEIESRAQNLMDAMERGDESFNADKNLNLLYSVLQEINDQFNGYVTQKKGKGAANGGKSKPKANPNRRTKSKPVADLTPTEVVSEAIAVSAEVDENPTTENQERQLEIEERIDNQVAPTNEVTTETEVVAESPAPAPKPKKSRGKEKPLPEGVEDMFTEARVSGRRTSWMKKDGKWFFRNHKPGTKISEQQFERDWQEATGKDIERAERMAAMDHLSLNAVNSAKKWLAAWGNLVTVSGSSGAMFAADPNAGESKRKATHDAWKEVATETFNLGIDLAKVLAAQGRYTAANWREKMMSMGDHMAPWIDMAWEQLSKVFPEGSTSADIQTNVVEEQTNEKSQDVKKERGRQATTDTMREFSGTNPAALNAALAAVDDTYEVMSIKGIFAEALAAVKKAGGFANPDVWADLLSEKEGEAKVLHHAKRMLAIRFYGELADQIQERMGDEATQEEMEAFEKAVSNMEVALDLVKNNNTWSGQQTSMMSEWRMVMANTVGYAKSKIDKYNEEILKSPKKGKAIRRKAKETKEQLNDIREQEGTTIDAAAAVDSAITDVENGTTPKAKKTREGGKPKTRIVKALGLNLEQANAMMEQARADMARAAREGFAGSMGSPAVFSFANALGRYGVAVMAKGAITFKEWAAKIKGDLPNVTDQQLQEAWDTHEHEGKTLAQHSKEALAAAAAAPVKRTEARKQSLRGKIRGAINDHFKKGAEPMTLEERLLAIKDEAGNQLLTEDEAAHIYETVKDEFEARVKAKVEARAKALKRKPKKESKPAKTDSQRAIEAMVDGEFTDEMVQEIFADRLGLIQQMTTEQVKTARALGKALDSTKPNTRSEAQAAMALDRFMYEILPPPSNGELFGELFKSIIYANMLMGIPTHLKNLITSGAMTVTSFVETAANVSKWKRAVRVAIKKGKETGDWSEASWLFLQASPITELAVKTQALARGWSKGARIAWDIMKSGYIDSKYIDQGKAKLGRLSPILERHRFGKYNPANVFKYVGRALSAEDAWMYSINNEMELADATRRHFLDGKAGGPMTLTRDVSRRMAKSNPLYADSLKEAEADIDKIADAVQMTPAEKARAIKIRAREILIDKIGLTEDEVQQAEDVARSRIFTLKRNGLWGKTATLMTKINNTKGIGAVSWIWMPFANIIGNLGDTFNDSTPLYGLLRANGISPTGIAAMLGQNKQSAMMSEPIQAEGAVDWIKKTMGGRQDQRYYEQMGRAWLGSMMMLTAMMLMDDDDKDDFIQFTGKNDPTHKNYLKIGGVPIISWELIPSIAPVAAIMSEAHSFHKLHPKEERSFGRRMLYAMGAVEQSVAGLSVAESVQNLNQVVGTALSSLTGVGNYGDPVDFEKGITTLGAELGKSGIGMLSRVNPLTNPLVGQIQQIFDPRVFSHSTIEQSMEYAALGATYRYTKDAEGNDRIAGVDIFGEEIKRLPSEDSFGFLSMFANEKAKDPRWKFLADHGGLEVMSRTTNANILFEDDEEKYGVVSRKMTDKQYGTYAKLAGQKFSKELTKYMNGNQWKKDYDIVVMGTAGTMTKLQEEVKKMASEARTKAKDEMDRMPESKGGFGGTRIGTKTYVKP